MLIKLNNYIRFIFTIIGIWAITLQAFSQRVKIDSTFGHNGKLVMENYPFDMSDNVIHFENGDLLFVAADEDNTPNGSSVFKINYNGEAIKDFGQDGIIPDVIDLKSSFVSAIKVQQDGSIIIAGTYRNDLNESAVFVTKFDSSGERVLNYGVDGVVTIGKQHTDLKISSVEIIDDNYLIMAGLIVINGITKAVMIKLKPNGFLDLTFGDNGLLMPLFSAKDAIINIKRTNDQKLILTGYAGDSEGKFLIAKMNFDGSLDKSFNGSGYNIFDILPGKHCEAFNFDFDQDENIVINGYVLDELISIACAKVSKNGVLDNSFGVSGKMIYNVGSASYSRSIRYLPDRSCLIFCFGSVSGQSPFNYDFLLLKIDSTGQLDPDFGQHGIFNIDMGYEIDNPSFLTMKDNAIYLGGYGNNGDNLPGATYIVKLLLTNETNSITNDGKVGSLRLYPSIVSDFISISSIHIDEENYKCSIYDMNGRQVMCNFNIDIPSDMHPAKIDVSHLSSGQYYIQLSAPSHVQLLKFVKL